MSARNICCCCIPSLKWNKLIFFNAWLVNNVCFGVSLKHLMRGVDLAISSRRECSRWVVHVLGWCWLPCMQAYSLCSFHPMHLLHKHLRTCIIQDHKPRAQSSYPRSLRSSSRCSRRKCPKPTRRTLRNFRSAPITARAPSREASPGAFLPVCNY